MSDDLSNRGEPDRSRINLGEDHEVAYWTQALGVSEEALRAAVRTAGSSVEAVRSHLARSD
jgi:hypothetical protein